MCKICQNWARIDGKFTEHHPACPHYNDSLIDVWHVHLEGQLKGGCYYDSEQSASEAMEVDNAQASPNDVRVVISKERMHREIYENLPEFEGF